MREKNNLIYENPISKEEATAQLIKAIALEEEALSNLINIETDKATAFVGKNLDYPTGPSTSEIIQYNQTVVQFLDTLLMAEWLLLKKMDTVRSMRDYDCVDSLGDRENKRFNNHGAFHDDAFDY
ncbi:hypothetical protein NQ117_16870 [Paenibacillus sp. SC116]|uniref:hypothetical protein n=1 Tax=Paenibacillus sp. SC116 TaxID=2968986 RepID=UPI00215B4C26|nr:hypothetical protein [Paenibacillus sp. SC116]MCR8845356.1 hypothetical protein [Paenibacillus sp. SC116]